MQEYARYIVKKGKQCRGGFRGVWEPPPPGVRKKIIFFALKIRKRNKACTIYCTVTLARVRWGIN